MNRWAWTSSDAVVLLDNARMSHNYCTLFLFNQRRFRIATAAVLPCTSTLLLSSPWTYCTLLNVLPSVFLRQDSIVNVQLVQHETELIVCPHMAYARRREPFVELVAVVVDYHITAVAIFSKLCSIFVGFYLIRRSST